MNVIILRSWALSLAAAAGPEISCTTERFSVDEILQKRSDQQH
jgi:hypothetical protein